MRNEESLLAGVEDPESYYIRHLLPRKLAASIREGWRRTIWRDVRVLVATVVPFLRSLAPLPDFEPLATVYRVGDESLVAELAPMRQATAQAGLGAELDEDLEVEARRVGVGA